MEDFENYNELEERAPTGKLIMVVLDNEILSVVNHEGVTEILSDESDVYVGTKSNLLLIATALGLMDTSKLDEF